MVAACSPGTESSPGGALARDIGCVSCHTGTDTSLAPSWHGLWGSEVELEDGSTVIVGEEYVRRSIEEPRADVVAGYGETMPQFSLTEEEIETLIDHIRSLG